jgi:hypothetical protein
MPQAPSATEEEVSAESVWERFQQSRLETPLAHISLDGRWHSREAETAAGTITADTGLPPSRVKEILQLYKINHVERILFERVADKRVELSKAVLDEDDLREVIALVATETSTPREWLWSRFPIGGRSGEI